MLYKSEDSLNDIFDAIRHELNRGALDSKHPFRFVSMATLSEEGPDVRYVVLRKIDKEFNFYFFTDLRTSKVAQLNKDNRITLLFYHPGKRVQIKVTGLAEIHMNDSLSQNFWSQVQGEAKKAYNSILAPRSIIPDPSLAYQWSVEKDYHNFGLIKLIPLEIEGLQLNGMTHIRTRFRKSEKENEMNSWSSEWLVP